MIAKSKVPQIRFKGFSGEWEDSGFSETFTNIPSNTLSRDELNYNFGLAKNIHYGDVLIKFAELLDIQKEKIPFISNSDYVNKLKTAKLQNGDIVIADAAEDEIVGKCTEIINVEKDTVLSGLHTIAVRPTQSFSSKYLGYYMNSSAYHNQLLPLLQGTKVLSISKSAIKNTTLFYPMDSLEQTKIGNYFNNLDKLIEQKENKHQKLKQLKKAMLEKMFPKDGKNTPEIRFKGFSGQWEENTLGDIGATYTGISGKTKEDFGHGEGRFVTYMNVYSNAITQVNFIEPIEIDEKQNEVMKGDVFFTTSSEVPEEVGMSSVWMNNIDNVYLNSFCFGYRLKKKLDNYYLAYMLRSQSFRKKIIFLAQGISRYNISKNKVMEIYINIPNINEQTKIGNYFHKLDKLIDFHQKELEKLKNIKKASLNKMFV